MNSSRFIMLAAAVLISACGGSGSETTSDAGTPAQPVAESPARAMPSASDVLAMMYSPSYTAPSGFFVDARSQTAESYTMHHVLDASNSFERCTDDVQQAMDWEAADNASRAVQGQFVATVETDRYFEVARELSYTESVGNISDITSPGFARVFKCSNTSRDGVDRTLTDGFAGLINARPLTSERLRTFTEYLWQFQFFPSGRRKVLDSYGEQRSGAMDHTLLLGFTTRDGDCDRVEVVDWQFTMDAATGSVEKRWSLVDSFRARLENGSPVFCD